MAAAPQSFSDPKSVQTITVRKFLVRGGQKFSGGT